MMTRHLVDPELLPLIDSRAAFELNSATLPLVRAASLEMRKQLAAGNEPRADVAIEERFLPGPEGAPNVRVLIYTPKTAAGRRSAHLHVHGGGYVVGSPEMAEARNAAYAAELACVVVSVDYRLAPETVFPGAVEDCYSALRWLYHNADALSVDRSRIAIGGESAGGGLAAALGLLARDRGEVPVIHQQLIYPMIDDRAPTDPHPNTGEFIWNASANRFGWSSLLGHEPGGPGVSPYAAAARAENLHGLPSTFISMGALDLFLEENLEYACRLSRAGVPLEFHIYPGAVHGFDLMPESRLAKQHARDQFDALRKALSPRAEAKK